MNIMDSYFELSDEVSKGIVSVGSIINLFDEQAVIEANNGNTYSGIEAIKTFFDSFFASSSELKHIWKSASIENEYEVKWGVVGKRKESGAIFILKGTDFATIDPTSNKIVHLRVVAD